MYGVVDAIYGVIDAIYGVIGATYLCSFIVRLSEPLDQRANCMKKWHDIHAPGMHG